MKKIKDATTIYKSLSWSDIRKTVGQGILSNAPINPVAWAIYVVNQDKLTNATIGKVVLGITAIGVMYSTYAKMITQGTSSVSAGGLVGKVVGITIAGFLIDKISKSHLMSNAKLNSDTTSSVHPDLVELISHIKERDELILELMGKSQKAQVASKNKFNTLTKKIKTLSGKAGVVKKHLKQTGAVKEEEQYIDHMYKLSKSGAFTFLPAIERKHTK